MFYVPDPTNRSDFIFCVFATFRCFFLFLRLFSPPLFCNGRIPLLQKKGVNKSWQIGVARGNVQLHYHIITSCIDTEH